MTVVPDRAEAAAYYFTYIDQVPEGDICELLEAQGKETLDLLGRGRRRVGGGLPDDRAEKISRTIAAAHLAVISQ